MSENKQPLTSSKIQLKLLVNKNTEKVIFAEADKEFMDFLIHLLSLPVATAARLLKEKTMDVGSVCCLYQSLQTLPDSYFEPNQNKNTLLNPTALIRSTSIPLIMSNHNFSTIKFYTCYQCSSHATANLNLPCPWCNHQMNKELTIIYPSEQHKGFLKELVTYIVTDNLEFMPMSTKLFVSLLNKFDVKDSSALEEIEVDLGIEEGLKLLKLTLECNTVLTSFYHEIRSNNNNFLRLNYGRNVSTSTEPVEITNLQSS